MQRSAKRSSSRADPHDDAACNGTSAGEQRSAQWQCKGREEWREWEQRDVKQHDCCVVSLQPDASSKRQDRQWLASGVPDEATRAGDRRERASANEGKQCKVANGVRSGTGDA